jgi:riboflavin transporter FmnP
MNGGYMIHKLTTREIAIAAALSALSATVQLIHVGYRSPQWGMWIDVVAVSWIIAYFLFGIRLSLLVTCIGALIITLFAPDTWLGASMKLIATVPVILSLFVWQFARKKSISHYSNINKIIIPLVLGIMLRCLIVIPLNYYYAIPIWTGMTPSVAMKAIPWFVIAGFNIVQSIIDVILAWIIVYRFKLSRFSLGHTE